VLVEDRGRFVDLIITEFKTLHAGNVVRFGIRPLEFMAWQDNAKVSN
jgi:aconitase A